MNNNISKETIDFAGKMRQDTGLPWADIAEEAYKQGHRYINQTRGSKDKIHNYGLHKAVTSDPAWRFLKTRKTFSDNKLGYIVASMSKHGATSNLMESVINDLRLLDEI